VAVASIFTLSSIVIFPPLSPVRKTLAATASPELPVLPPVAFALILALFPIVYVPWLAKVSTP
jgi:hypothetical protein